MIAKEITGVEYSGMINYGVRNLNRHVEKVNNLNVFPIPDGDTGDNMMMTLQGGAKVQPTENGNLSDTATKVAKGMLLSARGNSGVILSQFFAGIADGFGGLEYADAEAMGNAFRQGVQRAYESVMTPTEGTILTVAKDATKAACEAQCENAVEFLQEFVDAAKESLERTPELLHVLKEAGVVDSGGAGLVYIAEGMKSYLSGEEDDGVVDFHSSRTIAGQSSQASSTLDVDQFGPDDILEFGYCTETLLRLQNSKCGNVDTFDVNIIKDYLATIGNSIVCIKNDSIVKMHVHTMEPYKVLQFCQQYGEFLTLKVENMMLQHNEIVNNDSDAPKDVFTKGADAIRNKGPKAKHAVVTVANGDGIKEAFEGLGADCVITGGQTMNPSSEDFIKAFEQVNAENIYVLPNNKNIIMAAKQAAELYTDSKVFVIETKTIGDAYAVLGMMDTTGDNGEEIAASMAESMECVDTIEITTSIRDTVLNGLEIKSGNHMAILGKEIVSSTDDLVETAKAAIDRIDLDEKGIVLIIRGKDGSVEQAEAIKAYVKSINPFIDIEECDGMQDVYSFYVVAE